MWAPQTLWHKHWSVDDLSTPNRNPYTFAFSSYLNFNLSGSTTFINFCKPCKTWSRRDKSEGNAIAYWRNGATQSHYKHHYSVQISLLAHAFLSVSCFCMADKIIREMKQVTFLLTRLILYRNHINFRRTLLNFEWDFFKVFTIILWIFPRLLSINKTHSQ